MKLSLSLLLLLLLNMVFINILKSQGAKIETDDGFVFLENNQLCRGKYWSEKEGKKKLNEFSNLWNDKKTWTKRANLIRNKILQGIEWNKINRFSDKLKTIRHSKKIMNGYSVENIAIESFPGFYVTGNLYSPIKIKKKYPAILSPHGHLKNKRFNEDVQFRSAYLARLGAIVFSYDMVGYGESNQVRHKIPISLLLQTWNSKRVLDYLFDLPEVDKEQIGMTGGSGGGTQTFMLTGIDPRIKVAVPVVQVSAHFFGGCVCESGMPIHKDKDFQTNNVEIAALSAPRPLLIVSNGDDWTRNTPEVEFPYLRKVYNAFNREGLLENIHLINEKHDYGYSKRIAMYRFFLKHLDLELISEKRVLKFDESFIEILPRDQLEVFSDENPRPSSALKDEIEVYNFLGFPINQKPYSYYKN